MILRFCSGSVTPAVAEELFGGVDVDHLGVQAAGEHVHHHLAFVRAQQAMVDEHAGELVADGAMDQRGGHGGVHAAGQAEDHFLVADLLADHGHGLGDVVAHDPVGARAGNASTKRSISSRPFAVWVTSGWNCTP